MKNKLPPSYHKVTDVCKNCARCFALSEIDDPTTYFCMYRAPKKRPLCCSVGMDESCVMNTNWDKYITKKAKKARHDLVHRTVGLRLRAWEKWSAGRVVASNGLCDHFKAHKKVEATQ